MSNENQSQANAIQPTQSDVDKAIEVIDAWLEKSAAEEAFLIANSGGGKYQQERYAQVFARLRRPINNLIDDLREWQKQLPVEVDVN